MRGDGVPRGWRILCHPNLFCDPPANSGARPRPALRRARLDRLTHRRPGPQWDVLRCCEQGAASTLQHGRLPSWPDFVASWLPTRACSGSSSMAPGGDLFRRFVNLRSRTPCSCSLPAAAVQRRLPGDAGSKPGPAPHLAAWQGLRNPTESTLRARRCRGHRQSQVKALEATGGRRLRSPPGASTAIQSVPSSVW